MQSLFPYSNRPGFKQFPWIWKGSQKVNKEVEVIAKHYEESLDNAEKYYEILKSSTKGKEKLKCCLSINDYNHNSYFSCQVFFQ